MKTMAIIQARMGSVRFPNKVMMKIYNIPMIEIIFSRWNKAKNISYKTLITQEMLNVGVDVQVVALTLMIWVLMVQEITNSF